VPVQGQPGRPPSRVLHYYWRALLPLHGEVCMNGRPEGARFFPSTSSSFSLPTSPTTLTHSQPAQPGIAASNHGRRPPEARRAPDPFSGQHRSMAFTGSHANIFEMGPPYRHHRPGPTQPDEPCPPQAAARWKGMTPLCTNYPTYIRLD
jgi:hypothetical protein